MSEPVTNRTPDDLPAGTIVRVKGEPGLWIITGETPERYTLRKVGWLERVGIWIQGTTEVPNWVICLTIVAAVWWWAR